MRYIEKERPNLSPETSKEEDKNQTSRIIIEKKDGSVDYLEGEDAINWQKATNDLVELGGIHNREGQDEYNDLQTKWKKGKSLKSISSPK